MPNFLLLFLFGTVQICHTQSAEYNKDLEKELLKDYNRMHRPVKKESTTVNVQVYLSVSHIEQVNEHEQTMMVHGHLWSTWVDEYLKWDPAKYNGTARFNIDTWRIWQPALALYNSAKGNSWHLYMSGLPAIVNNFGKVWASGSFSFYVTCMFDFSNWPYDEQECPIVIADWVYDLSKVNLSDPMGDTPWNKPSIRLNYNPRQQEEKRHVAGWEVMDTWRRHCYWGQSGCKSEIPEGQPEWYWSLLEFGVKLKRHAPYFTLTVVLPTIACSLLTLSSFWIDTLSISVALLVFNVILQGLFGWDLIRELPPGSGSVPKIVSLYGLNLSLTTISFVIHVLIQYLEAVLPDEVVLPLPQLSSLPQKIRSSKLFQTKGLSFDPQANALKARKLILTTVPDRTVCRRITLLLNGEPYEDTSQYNSPLPQVGSSVSLSTALTTTDDHSGVGTSAEQLVDVGSGAEQTTSTDTQGPSADTALDIDPSQSSPLGKTSTLSHQLFLFRRIVFIGFAICYLIALPICLINW